jgi:hypothetical protein
VPSDVTADVEMMEVEMKVGVGEDWLDVGSVLAEHPELVTELAGIDARLKELW